MVTHRFIPFQYLKEAAGKLERDSLSGSVWIGQGVITLKQVRFRLDIQKKFFAIRVVRPCTGCLEKLWLPHPWLCPRPG